MESKDLQCRSKNGSNTHDFSRLESLNKRKHPTRYAPGCCGRYMKKLCAAIILVFPGFVFGDDVKTYKLEEGVILKIHEIPFKKSHKITDCKEFPKAVCLIDGHIPFGIDLNLPTKEFDYIKLEINGFEYYLDTSDMYDGWGDRQAITENGYHYFQVICDTRLNCKARGNFSDGAGAYDVEWTIRFGTTTRTLISDTNDINFCFDNCGEN